MNRKRLAVVLGLSASVSLALAGCGAGGSSTTSNSGSGLDSGSSNGIVSTMVSDSPVNDWATIGVRVMSIALNPQGGGAPVTVYTASSAAPFINLVQLDQLGELLANASVPAGTYTSATLTLSANSGDVMLTASEDPDPGFAGTAGATVPSNQIQIQGTSGSAGSKTVSLNVNFVSNLVVTANQNNQMDLEFDLSHPAFLIAHQPPAAGGATIWAINFAGPVVHHHPIYDITRFLLRDVYGTVNSISSDDSSITVAKDYAVEPPTNPETEITSSQMLNIQADATNGTLFYDLDGKTKSTIFDFKTLSATLSGKFVRVAARYQAGGQLVAVRIWASTSFNTVWVNPEGHVLHVNATNDTLTVTNEVGSHVKLSIDSNTQFFFRTPGNAQTDSGSIGTGPAFLANLERGFKVHVKVVDPLASPLVADTVDIEIARFDGGISLPTPTNFTYTRNFATTSDDYVEKAFFISNNTANGNDPLTGDALKGFKWWNFSFPTIVTSGGSSAIASFEAADNSVNFGGSVGVLTTYGESRAIWNDPANPSGWAVPSSVLLPSPVPLGTVLGPYSSSTGNFGMTALGGTTTATVDVSTTAGSATLVYQVDRNGSGILTISPVDITTTAGLATFTSAMVNGTLVRIAGLPESAAGHVKAYVIFYFTGAVMPAS